MISLFIFQPNPLIPGVDFNCHLAFCRSMPLPTLLAFLINMDNSALDISEHNTTGWTAHGCAFLDDRHPHLMVEMISNAHGEDNPRGAALYFSNHGKASEIREAVQTHNYSSMLSFPTIWKEREQLTSRPGFGNLLHGIAAGSSASGFL